MTLSEEEELTRLTMTRGDNKTARSVILDVDDADFIWIPGVTKAWFTARRTFTDAAPVFAHVSGIGGDIDISTNGLALTPIVPADTADLPNEETVLVFDVQIKDAGGGIRTVEKGTIVVKPEVTTAT